LGKICRTSTLYSSSLPGLSGLSVWCQSTAPCLISSA
jgi:hypothetical protein